MTQSRQIVRQHLGGHIDQQGMLAQPADTLPPQPVLQRLERLHGAQRHRGFEVTDNSVGDGPMLSELLGQMPPDEPTASISADGAYDTKACHAAITERGALSLIPSRKNAHRWIETLEGATVRNEALKACHRLACRIWKKWCGYHGRNLFDTKMQRFMQLRRPTRVPVTAMA